MKKNSKRTSAAFWPDYHDGIPKWMLRKGALADAIFYESTTLPLRAGAKAAATASTNAANAAAPVLVAAPERKPSPARKRSWRRR